MPWTKDYEDFQRDQEETLDLSVEDNYTYQQDLDLSALDTYVGDDDWHKTYVVTGSIDIDPDWI